MRNFYSITAKIWPLGAEVIFLPKNFILKYFQKLMRFQLLLDKDKFMVRITPSAFHTYSLYLSLTLKRTKTGKSM